MPTPNTVGLEDYAHEHAKAQFAENAEIARANRTLRATLAERERLLESIQKRLGLYERLEEERIAPPTWLVPKPRKKEYQGIPSLMLADLHWDEVIDPSQIGGVNAYNRAIAEQRLKRAFERTIRTSRDCLSGVHMEGFNLFLPGDMISGVIHEELRETNEAQVMDSVLSLLEPMEAGIKTLAAEFGRVHITGVVGNHGRNTRKPRAKFRAQDNFDWLVYKLLQRDMSGLKGVTMQVSTSADDRVQIYSTKYLLTHGDQFRGGSGISGAMAPLLLGVHRKMAREAAAGTPFDVMVMGHFHQSLPIPQLGLVVGGSLKGYDEYAYVNNFRIEPAQLAFWLTTPEFGVQFSSNIVVQDREAEGW